MKLTIAVAMLLGASTAAAAQDATMIYRLGHDTVAIEQISRTPTHLAGESVLRQGTAITRSQYDVTLAGGKPTVLAFRRRQADGTPIPNTPVEWRLTFGADSTRRDIVWKDSTQSQTFATKGAFINIPVYSYGLFELVRGRDSIPAIGLAGNAVGVVGLRPYAADTLRMRGGAYDMLVRFDREGHLMWTDGVFTTNKAIGTRQAGKVDVASLATSMKPTGVLSPRAQAYAGFNRGPIFISYGRPAVRDRTVWGGILIPFDSIWRAGANEATHLATSKTIALGDMTLAPGLYTLWIQHTHAGTYLIVNKQVGQWGTEYQAAQDLGRVKMDMAKTPSHVEDFTITVRATGPNRGAFDFAWGDSVATAAFTVRP